MRIFLLATNFYMMRPATKLFRFYIIEMAIMNMKMHKDLYSKDDKSVQS